MTPPSRALLLASASLLALGATGCAASGSSGSDSGGSSPKSLVYQVKGPGKTGAVTWTDGGTKTSQDTEAKLPWKMKIPINDKAIVYQVNAQNSDMASKKIKCVITDQDGKVLDSNVGKGQGAIAQCQWNPNE